MDAPADDCGGVVVAGADRVGGGGWREQHGARCAVGVHRNTVSLWRRRFVEFRLDGLLDEPRPGQPRKITDAQVE